MIKRICDCCGEKVTKEFVKLRINWSKADAVSGESMKDHNTPYLEYCENCFNNLLGKLGLEKE